MDPQVHQWFAAVDTDRSGRIEARELQQALMSSNGRKFAEEACRMMIGLFDGGSKAIDINSFSHLFNYVNQWMQAFKSYDRDGSGFINSHELSSALQTMGYRFSQQFVETIAKKFGEPQGMAVDGFIMACILIQKFTEGFRAKDTQQQGVVTIGYEDFLSMVLSAWT